MRSTSYPRSVWVCVERCVAIGAVWSSWRSPLIWWEVTKSHSPYGTDNVSIAFTITNVSLCVWACVCVCVCTLMYCNAAWCWTCGCTVLVSVSRDLNLDNEDNGILEYIKYRGKTFFPERYYCSRLFLWAIMSYECFKLTWCYVVLQKNVQLEYNACN